MSGIDQLKNCPSPLEQIYGSGGGAGGGPALPVTAPRATVRALPLLLPKSYPHAPSPRLPLHLPLRHTSSCSGEAPWSCHNFSRPPVVVVSGTAGVHGAPSGKLSEALADLAMRSRSSSAGLQFGGYLMPNFWKYSRTLLVWPA